MLKRIISSITVLALVISSFMLTSTLAFANTSLDADAWGEQAIVAPEAGKLIGAGYIDVKFKNNLDKASTYSVYVDGKLQKTVNATEEEILTVEFYTTAVSAHTAYIVATTEDGTTVQTPEDKFYVTKKGICVNTNDMGAAVDPADLNCGWYYNWGYRSFKEQNYTNKKFDNLEFVPMIWGIPSVAFNKIFESTNNQGYKFMLGYNEPDLQWESDVSYGKAANDWNYNFVKYKDKMRLGSTSVSYFPSMNNAWWPVYWNALGASGRNETSFIALHNYQKFYDGKESALQYLEALDATYEKYRKPIWLTEFAVWKFDKSDKSGAAKTQEFMKIVLKGLNQRSYVERYSWFSPSYEEKAASSSSLFVYSTGEITLPGKIYAQIGNPAGYPSKTYGVSSDISTDTSVKSCIGIIKTTLYGIYGKKKAFKYDIKSVRGAAGYQLTYSLNKKFSKKKKYKTKTINIKPSSSNAKMGTVKKLKKKKTYYAKVRAYKKFGGKTYYCKWSGREKCKTKK